MGVKRGKIKEKQIVQLWRDGYANEAVSLQIKTNMTAAGGTLLHCKFDVIIHISRINVIYYLKDVYFENHQFHENDV